MADRDETGQGGFAALFEEMEKKQRSTVPRQVPRVGDVVRGEVVSIGADAVFVDVGAKAEALMDLADVTDDDGSLTVAVGDVVEAHVTGVDSRTGSLILASALGRGSMGDAELQNAFELGVPVEGVVSGVNKGGAEVTIAGRRGFCPISQLDMTYVDDPARFVGQRLSFRITRLTSDDVVLSRRALLEEEARKAAKETRERLRVGAVVTGQVTRLQDYGAFVDLGGLEGLLHVSELSFVRGQRPKDLLSVGQTVEVEVLRIEQTGDPKRPEKIALSMRSLTTDPFVAAARSTTEGQRLKGKVTRIERYGAFVELSPGVEGLVHVSELAADRRVSNPREVVKPGQEVEVTVLAVDEDKRRISLSMAREGSGEGAPTSYTGSPGSLGTFGDLLKKRLDK